METVWGYSMGNQTSQSWARNAS